MATDTRLYMRSQIGELREAVGELLRVLVEKAERYRDTIIFGYTHLQRAQPISAGHYYLAYFNMFVRDRDRLDDLMKRVNISPLGAAAFAGSTLPPLLAESLGKSLQSFLMEAPKEQADAV